MFHNMGTHLLGTSCLVPKNKQFTSYCVSLCLKSSAAPRENVIIRTFSVFYQRQLFSELPNQSRLPTVDDWVFALTVNQTASKLCSFCSFSVCSGTLLWFTSNCRLPISAEQSPDKISTLHCNTVH